MNARNKLNVAYANGSVIIAGIVGLLAQSWTIFGLVLIGLLIGHFVSGAIRTR